MTSLDRLLKSLDPNGTQAETAARADRALLTFRPPSAQVENGRDYCNLLTSLCLHSDKEILGLPPHYEGDPDFILAKCREILNRAYGPNGYMTGFDMARSGQGGGLYAVMKTLSKGLAEEYTKQEIAARVWSYINGLSATERIAAAREYAEKWRRLIPLEYLEGGAIRLIDRFPEILLRHSEIVSKMRRVGK